jgi:hypothetical protein
MQPGESLAANEHPQALAQIFEKLMILGQNEMNRFDEFPRMWTVC